MSDWLSSPAANFVAVAAGAALGAVLTVWWTNRALDRHSAEQAYRRLRERLYSLFEARAGNDGWRREVLAVTTDIELVAWHSRRRLARTRKNVKPAARTILLALDDQLKVSGQIVDWKPVFAALGDLKQAVYGSRFQNLYPEDRGPIEPFPDT